MFNSKSSFLSTVFSGCLPPGAGVTIVILLVMVTALLARADSPNRVGLVIEFGDGDIIKQCVEFSTDTISGYEILEQAGLDLSVDLSNGMGAAVCSINNEGCAYPENECFCQCAGDGICEFWSYWLLTGDSWEFAGMGVSGTQAGNGDVQGWKWGQGTVGRASPPPVLTFDDICEPPATATPQPTVTPTLTPIPTPTPPPTNTPRPPEKPVIHYFSASQTEIVAGQSTQLSWDLSAADVAYLRYNGIEEGVVAPGQKIVSPTESTVYTLAARNGGEETTLQVRITVNPPPTPTPVPTTIMAKTVPAPTATPVPSPVINFTAAAYTLPSGACTNLQWSSQYVQALFLDGSPVAGQGVQEICPPHTQTFRLQAVYPNGEKTVELTLTVIETGLYPTATLIPVIHSDTAPPLAPAEQIVMAPTSVPETPTGPRRFTISPLDRTGQTNSNRWIGAALIVGGLLVASPLGLIIAGWLVWWYRSKN